MVYSGLTELVYSVHSGLTELVYNDLQWCDIINLQWLTID